MIFFGIAGLLLITFGLWVSNERYQNIVFIIGGLLLLVYSIFIEDIIFIVLQGIFTLSATGELFFKRPK